MHTLLDMNAEIPPGLVMAHSSPRRETHGQSDLNLHGPF